ncbi:MAG: hypothetical protein WCK71_02205 [bacterium]|jgi:hypothetical protein
MNIGFDIIFFATVMGSAVACFMIGEEKTQRLVIGTLVGILAGSQLAEPIEKIVSAKASFINQSNIAIALLALSVIICLLGKNVRESKWPKSKIKSVIAGLLLGFVIIGYGLSLLGDSSFNKLVTEHNLAAIAYNMRLVSISGLLMWLMASYIFVGKAKR